MDELMQKIEEAAHMIKDAMPDKMTPKVGMILGTGLGGLGETMTVGARIPYAAIPHFSTATVASHAGELLCGHIGGKATIAMQGRFHYYEGYSLAEITFPVRVMRYLGIDTLIVSNAAGGLNPLYQTGDLVIITDHINLMGDNPLIGKNDDRLGVRFPDMSQPYDRSLIQRLEAIALDEKVPINKGVYVAVSGPCLETAAEYRFMRLIGADMVGMSTVPEVIVGVHAGLKIVGISCVTDMCLPDALTPACVEDIIAVAAKSEPLMHRLIAKLMETL